MNSPKTTEPAAPRVMYALIALADLPTPNSIHHHSGIWSMEFPRVAEGQAWSAHLGGSADTYLNSDGRLYLREGLINWRGWSVHLHASEPVTPDDVLDADTAGQLQAIVVTHRVVVTRTVDPDPGAIDWEGGTAQWKCSCGESNGQSHLVRHVAGRSARKHAGPDGLVTLEGGDQG